MRLQVGMCCAVLLASSCGRETPDESTNLPEEISVDQREDQARTSGARPLLVVLMSRPGTSLAHDATWYRDKKLAYVQDYFLKLSRRQFTFNVVSVVSVVDDTSVDAAAGVVSGDSDTTKTRKRARYLAGKQGFNFAAYDGNGDGKVTTSELTILSIDNYSEGSAQTGTPACTQVNGTSVCSAVSLVGHRSRMMNYAHELSHTLTPTSRDLYGASCLSQGATLMSCTGGSDENDNSAAFLDPWHRAQYDWTGSSFTSGNTTGGWIDLYGVGHGSGKYETLTIVSPGGSDAVTFELRSGYTYSSEDNKAVGLFAWYQIGYTRSPYNIASLTVANGRDPSLFTVGPASSCVLDPNSSQSRGKVTDLNAGEYSIAWWDGGGATSVYIDRGYDSQSGYGYYRIAWDQDSNARRLCGSSSSAASAAAYELRVTHSGKCLDVDVSSNPTSNGRNVQQWSCYAPDQQNQNWRLIRVGPDDFEIRAVHSDMCLDADDNRISQNGANVQQWSCNSADQQRWQLVANGSSYWIRNKKAGKCLDVSNAGKDDGVNVQLWDCVNVPQQLWKPVLMP